MSANERKLLDEARVAMALMTETLVLRANATDAERAMVGARTAAVQTAVASYLESPPELEDWQRPNDIIVASQLPEHPGRERTITMFREQAARFREEWNFLLWFASRVTGKDPRELTRDSMARSIDTLAKFMTDYQLLQKLVLRIAVGADGPPVKGDRERLRCPTGGGMGEGSCWWCEASLGDGYERIEHGTGCPWPEVEKRFTGEE